MTVAEPLRQWNAAVDTGPVVVWSCRVCGPCLSSRSDWCDLGCGNDYNQMTKMALWAHALVERDVSVDAPSDHAPTCTCGGHDCRQNWPETTP